MKLYDLHKTLNFYTLEYARSLFFKDIRLSHPDYTKKNKYLKNKIESLLYEISLKKIGEM